MARLTERFAQQAKLLNEERTPAKSGNVPSFGVPSGNGGRPVLTELLLTQITPDPDQPRRDLGDLTGLTDSIAEMGVVQPIIVTIVGYDAYRIVAGERRYTAAKAAGLVTIPAIVRSVEEQERLALQLIENLHRKDLNPFEEARSYQRLMEEFNFTQKDIAKRLGRTQGSISEVVRLLDLPAIIQNEYEQDHGESKERITKSLLLEIARVDAKKQRPLWEVAKRGELTVKQVRAEKQTPVRGRATATTTLTTAAPKESKTMGFRFPIQTSEALVTVAFDRPKATTAEIVAALEEALVGEKARLE